MLPSTIAMDGPAGCGKSTLGAELARRLGYSVLDIGVVYRLVTLRAIAGGRDVRDSSSVLIAASEVLTGLRVDHVSGETSVTLDGVALDRSELQSRAVTEAVPLVAMHEEVRVRIREVQRAVAAGGRAILAGRDIGTVVLPEAELKLYLDVSLEERAARRRWSLAADDPTTQSEIARQLATRDQFDAERHHSPLRIPDDSVVIRTDRLTVDEAVELIIAMCGLAA